ncbi:hypothetical protein VP01_2813g4 [Puccinia sorghi]|uniref:Uncharacterized protein n=1 Tax=Puccinia sorghi TaxID=27349 RepID=A0A0L6V2F5_9BASI|nr:hypothetical protein VP01_2813g4 [Puccinia sorghi]
MSTRSISPESLQSSVSSSSSYSLRSPHLGSSSSDPIHPTLYIRDPRRQNHRNGSCRHQLTESDFGFRPPTPLSTKIRRLFCTPPPLLPKVLLNRNPLPQAPTTHSARSTSNLPHHHRKSLEHVFLDASLER